MANVLRVSALPLKSAPTFPAEAETSIECSRLWQLVVIGSGPTITAFGLPGIGLRRGSRAVRIRLSFMKSCGAAFEGRGFMRRRFVTLLAFIWLGVAGQGVAQEGHPLTGTWAGDWGPSVSERNHLTIVLAWDGKNVTGTINPGPDAAPIGSVFLDVTNWTIRFEADGKDRSGASAHISVEGRLEDIGSAHRKITGTWRQGSVKGDFRITRD